MYDATQSKDWTAETCENTFGLRIQQTTEISKVNSVGATKTAVTIEEMMKVVPFPLKLLGDGVFNGSPKNHIHVDLLSIF